MTATEPEGETRPVPATTAAEGERAAGAGRGASAAGGGSGANDEPNDHPGTGGRRRRRRSRWLVAYLVLLALSHVAQLVVPAGPWALVESGDRPSVPGTIEAVTVPAFGAGGRELARPAGVRVALRALDPVGTAAEDAPVVVLLHGSPGSARNFEYMQPALAAAGYRTLALDLPGFGRSQRSVPDYGIDAHAGYVLATMDALEIERAHVVGWSMGSGVALEMADTAPERVRTITMLGGIGIQEAEGSGDYVLEHVKYRTGWVLGVALPEALPHFGVLGPRSLRRATIRNFMDTDQRPLRGILERIEMPVLVLHGAQDFLVPAWGAREHHDIVEHSELVMLEQSHFGPMIEDQAAELSTHLIDFLDRMSVPGATPERRTTDLSDPERSAADAETHLGIDHEMSPYAQLAALAAATFVSEDLTCIAAGLLVRAGELDLFVAVAGCVLGIFLGDVGLWLIGRVLGRRVYRLGWIRKKLPVHHIERVGAWLDDHAGKAVLGSRFLPGTRLPLYVTAGMLGRRPLRFFCWFAVASIIWTPILVVLALVFGAAVKAPLERWFGHGWHTILIAAIVILVAVRTVVSLFDPVGRLRLRARFARVRRWEFWPAWIFYAPVLPWIAWLSLRHRGFTVVTAANPGIPHGGFVGESKSRILEQLPQERVTPFALVEPGSVAERVEHVCDLATTWGWPVILKPDAGERGAAVRRIDGPNDAELYFDAFSGPILAQAYEPGPGEAGIFWLREPGQERGRLFSITDKKFSWIEGDGEHTLRELVWRHPRYRMQAGMFLRRHAADAERVLDAGERFLLAMAGNHCQGTKFVDGEHLRTPELERAIEAIASSIEGFRFGRFDVRYAGDEDLRRGEGFRIIELNGATSEATHIYDPEHTLLDAYRTLFTQWSLLFRIGAAARDEGVPPSSLRELVRAVVVHRRRDAAGAIAD